MEGSTNDLSDDLKEDFDDYIRPIFRSKFPPDLGAAITRRIDEFVPYFDFTKPECVILADTFVSEVTVDLRKKKDTGKPIGR